jgi:hypothetical protein
MKPMEWKGHGTDKPAIKKTWRHKSFGLSIADVVGGQPNPMWVEWLMGFPIGWTDLKD